MRACNLLDEFAYRAGPANPTGHGFIELAYQMPFSQYQGLIG